MRTKLLIAAAAVGLLATATPASAQVVFSTYSNPYVSPYGGVVTAGYSPFVYPGAGVYNYGYRYNSFASPYGYGGYSGYGGYRNFATPYYGGYRGFYGNPGFGGYNNFNRGGVYIGGRRGGVYIR